MKRLILCFIIILILPITYAETNLDYGLKPTFHKFFPITGGSVEYEFTIKNIGDENLTNIVIYYDLKDPNKVSYGQKTFVIPTLNINETYTYKEEWSYHFSVPGEYPQL